LLLSYLAGSGGNSGGASAKTFSQVIGPMSLDIVGSLVLCVGGVFLASAMGGVSFTEKVPVIIYKLIAVALAPGAIGILTKNYIGGFNGDIASVFAMLACYFALFALLFRLPNSDRFVCVMIMFIIRAAANYLLFRLEGAKNDSMI
jgi:hypothetical protein